MKSVWTFICFFAVLSSCTHLRNREGLLVTAANSLNCTGSQLNLTEYDAYRSMGTVEGCGRVGHFWFFEGRWRLTSRCRFKVLPDIPHCCTPNPGGRHVCEPECNGVEPCLKFLTESAAGTQ